MIPNMFMFKSMYVSVVQCTFTHNIFYGKPFIRYRSITCMSNYHKTIE